MSEGWNADFEAVVKKEGEQSQSLYWIHNASAKWTANLNDYIQIPGIILASVTGFLSATTNLIPPVGIGAMSLFVGVLNTINSYYKYSQRSEAHKITAQLYFKMFKNIELELNLPIHQRTDAAILLKNLREKMERISEVAPEVPESVIHKYRKTFAGSSVSKPIIANDLDEIIVCVSQNREPPALENTNKIHVPYMLKKQQTAATTAITSLASASAALTTATELANKSLLSAAANQEKQQQQQQVKAPSLPNQPIQA